MERMLATERLNAAEDGGARERLVVQSGGKKDGNGMETDTPIYSLTHSAVTTVSLLFTRWSRRYCSGFRSHR